MGARSRHRKIVGLTIFLVALTVVVLSWASCDQLGEASVGRIPPTATTLPAQIDALTAYATSEAQRKDAAATATAAAPVIDRVRRRGETLEDYLHRIGEKTTCERTLGQVVNLAGKDVQLPAGVCLTGGGSLAEGGRESGRISTFVGREDKQTGVTDRGVVASDAPIWDDLRDALKATGLPG